ncbi:MAG: hypothetical protein KAR42_08605 [candidate division Zixibacteria bacterium]|nr:hypothetical protein [candidate division Zixibacteria bacterium]
MVRPIDLQDNLAKTQAVERLNQIQKAHGEVGQKVVADALKEKTAAEMEKARASEKMDMVIIRREEEEKERHDRQQKRKKGRKKDNGAPVEHLDVSG